jgi:hypothetical protein
LLCLLQYARIYTTSEGILGRVLCRKYEFVGFASFIAEASRIGQEWVGQYRIETGFHERTGRER